MEKSPNWIIEKYIFDENLDKFQSIFKKHNINYKVVEYFPFMDFNPDDYFGPDEIVIFYGSLNFASLINKKAKWIPGVWGNLSDLKCSNYYNHFGEYLLNSDYIMLPYGELHRRKDFLFNLFGVDDCIFIRPDDGFKTFTGTTVKLDNYQKEVDYLGFYDVDKSNIVIVSSPKKIDAEYRFICIDGKIVTGSTYKTYGEKNEISEYPIEARDFAQKIASVWQPEMCFTIDVALSSSSYHLLEINSFSSSGFYCCDIESIVLAANEAAIKDYFSYEI